MNNGNDLSGKDNLAEIFFFFKRMRRLTDIANYDFFPVVNV